MVRQRTTRTGALVATLLLAAVAGSGSGLGGCYSGGPTGASTTDGDGGAGGADGGVLPFQADPPEVYVAKVKNILTGLAATDDEVKSVAADPSKLASLIDTWMSDPAFAPFYEAKMRVFFELAFQQTQITTTDFTDLVPQGGGIGISPQTPLLVQNVKESFARTMLALTDKDAPLTQSLTTDTYMMTPALMELYAFLDWQQVTDAETPTDRLRATNPSGTITLEASAGPIPLSETLDPTSANYMHWYYPDVASTNRTEADCNVDPRSYPLSAHDLHLVLYGSMPNYKGTAGSLCGQFGGKTTESQFTADDFTTWKMVKVRRPAQGEAITKFWDVPSLRAANELVLATPRVGFFTTPAFFANWQTNTSNQMRVTLNQTLIVATGKDVDGTDTTSTGPNPPALDAEHASSDPACFNCHQTLDPSRAIFQAEFSYGYGARTSGPLTSQKGEFAFQGVIQQVSSMTDLGKVLAAHPAFAEAWVQKLCYYATSQPCAADDPEFQRIVSDFKGTSFSWKKLVRELLSSPITTNATETKTASEEGELVPVTRRDHLCAELDARLGLTDVCGLDVAAPKKNPPLITTVAAGLPSDGYGRGAPIPVLPNAPTLFYRAATENICESVATLVVDPTAKVAAKTFDSGQPDASIASLVTDFMGVPPSDARNGQLVAILKKHFGDAQGQGASPTEAMRSTFVAACLSPSIVGMGM